MKTKCLVSLVGILCILVATVSAAPVSVAFVDGTVHVLSSGTWKLLDFDDRFDSSQTVRLGRGAVLELIGQGGSTVAIATQGSFVVDDLLKPRTEPGVVATVAAKLEKLAQGSKADITVAGVRGSAAVEPQELMWAGDGVEAEAAFEEAMTVYKNGMNSEAWALFSEARLLYEDAADPNGAARSAWHASLAGLAAGSGAKALAALRAADPADAGALRGSYALALATLSARYGDTEGAKLILQKALASGWLDDQTMVDDAKSLLSGL
ncbi:MAG: hypothetical protein A3J97_16910 [Spirochaetes bacterium RIFOXYC1_FULL_54_7]|nr:MAG: hypothetical protein A3J97_16910 [Spirochaetes bacterium RIFOXYC1_FULL_54_7]